MVVPGVPEPGLALRVPFDGGSRYVRRIEIPPIAQPCPVSLNATAVNVSHLDTSAAFSIVHTSPPLSVLTMRPLNPTAHPWLASTIARSQKSSVVGDVCFRQFSPRSNVT